MKKDIRMLLIKTIAENCKLRSELQFQIKQNEILKNLFLGELNETI